jgi:cation diffusion facilitator CzcD-associated flavoprotein CzcO
MAFDQTKPANNSALVSAEVRGNFAAIQTAFGNPDTTPLTQKATTFLSNVIFNVQPTLSRGALVEHIVLAKDFGDHATSGTGATDVWSLAGNLPGGTLLDNETLCIEAFGDQTADANNKTFTVTLGTTAFTVVTTAAAVGWLIRFRLVRVSASVQRAFIETGVQQSIQTYGTGAENLGNALALKLTITHATSGTTTLRALRAWIETPTA